MRKYIAAIGIASVVALGTVVYTQSQKKVTYPMPTSSPTPRVQKNASYTFDFSEGSCLKDTECTWASQGCGGGHGICTNTPDKYKNMMSTCDINPDFPSNKGFSCGCVQNKCGWKK